MAIEIEQLIKIILGVLVVIAVAAGLYLLFKEKIIEFFKGISVGSQPAVFLSFIK